ncbi:MAG: Tol biopolymer transport system component [Hyphomicrobiaceae bacterium]|jgi:Tol biopolymer transport system component
MRITPHLSATLVVGLAALTLSSTGAEARGAIPMMEQVTHLTEGTIEDVRMRSERGTSIVFTSDGDVLGPGTAPGQKEVFYYNQQADTFVQITNTPGGMSYQGARATDTTGKPARPEIVAFVSTGDFDATMSNADGNPEIFLYELGTGIFHQITDTMPPIVNENPFPSDNGKCIVFDSNGDLHTNDGIDVTTPDTGFSNPDGSREVFLYDTGAPTVFPVGGDFTQISDGPAGTTSREPVIGGYWFPRQCQHTVFVSDFDQVDEGLTGNQLYIYTRINAKLDSMSGADRELPLGLLPGDYFRPFITAASNFARGPFTVFHTGLDLWNNASTGFNIFRYRIFHPQLTQLTDNAEGRDSRNPTIADGGGFIGFDSNDEQVKVVRKSKPDQPPFNADGNFEIFRIKGRRKMTQITRTTGCNNERPSMRDDGTSMGFLSDCDLVPGRNPNGVQQIFRYFQVRSSDPEFRDDGCLNDEDCCGPKAGCYEPIEGRNKRFSRRDCVERDPERCNEVR